MLAALRAAATVGRVAALGTVGVVAGVLIPNKTADDDEITPLLFATGTLYEVTRSRESVFLDNGALIALAQRRPDVIAAIGGRRIRTTFTAFGEFTVSRGFAGPTELAGSILVDALLVGNLGPSIPSARVQALVPIGGVGLNDKLIFGTADRLGLQIITGDRSFVNAAKAQGVLLDAIVLDPPPRFTGR